MKRYSHPQSYSFKYLIEFEPERGIRCTACFDMRMEVTALYAHENGFAVFTTTNAASRWKDLKQVNGVLTNSSSYDLHSTRLWRH